MTPNRIMAACVAALLCAALDGTWAGAAAQERSWQDYEVLVERNIFSRQRGRPRPMPGAPIVRRVPPPEQFIFLRGVLRTNGEFVAVLEDMRSGDLIRARRGDSVLAGEVGELTLDGMGYLSDGQTIEVAIGENLEKATTFEPVPAAAEAGAGPSAPAPTAPAAGGDILEQLRQRRMRELGR